MNNSTAALSPAPSPAPAGPYNPLDGLGLGPVLSQLGGDGGSGKKCPPGSLDCIETYKVDAQVWANLIVSLVLGGVCLVAFCFLQSYVSVYRSRLVSGTGTGSAACLRAEPCPTATPLVTARVTGRRPT
jgi:hypothetical protein